MPFRYEVTARKFIIIVTIAINSFVKADETEEMMNKLVNPNDQWMTISIKHGFYDVPCIRGAYYMPLGSLPSIYRLCVSFCNQQNQFKVQNYFHLSPTRNDILRPYQWRCHTKSLYTRCSLDIRAVTLICTIYTGVLDRFLHWISLKEFWSLCVTDKCCCQSGDSWNAVKQISL